MEIITWNDYGESHYIGPLRPKTFPAGSEWWVQNNPHDAWRNVLPAYIAAYKSGNTTVPQVTEQVVYAHLPQSVTACSEGVVPGNAPWEPAADAKDVMLNAIDLYVLVNGPASVKVQIGGGAAKTFQANLAGVNFFSVPFGSDSGEVTYIVTGADGKEIVNHKGASISNGCAAGKMNYNAIVGSSLQ